MMRIWYFISVIWFMISSIYVTHTTLQVSRHAHTSSRSSESCETSAVRQNVTLRGGIKAGYFHKLAQFVAMELCVQLCCQEKGCDVAFMIGNNCYGVKCFSEQLCGVVPAKNAPKALKISKVDFRGEVYLQKFMPEKLKCFKTSVEQNVTLQGGLSAGNFTAVGHAESVDACAKFCCVNDNCDLALLVNDNCFMVKCHTATLCSSTPTANTTFQTYIARVNRIKETDTDQQTVLALSSVPGKSPPKLLCKNGVVQFNQTLLGGYEAGKFKTLARSTNMSTCIRLCCGEKTCDVALMIEKKCYAVACHSLKQCRTIPAKNSVMLSHLNPRISFITSRNEEVTSIILQRQSEICTANVISYDVTLRGGKHAGKYKTFGEVDNMEECIRICCMEQHCDVAFMISGICFTVTCHNDDACEEVHAPGTGFKPMLSYVVREKPVKHETHHQKIHHQQKIHRKLRLRKKIGHHKTHGNNTVSPEILHMPSPNLPSLDNDHYCTNSEIMYNVTLQGGLNAGKYRDRGVLPNMRECLRICCIATTCDLAFMLGNRCLSVTCKNQSLCEVVTARSSAYNPRVAYIYARSKNADRVSNPGKSWKGHRYYHGKRPKNNSLSRIKNSLRNKDRFHKKKDNVHRKNKEINGTSQVSYRQKTNAKKHLPHKRLKLKVLTKNEYPTPQTTTDTVLSRAFMGVPKNLTRLMEFYKNNTSSSKNNMATLATNQNNLPLLNIKEGNFSITENSKIEYKLPVKIAGNHTKSRINVFQPRINITKVLLPYTSGTNVEYLPENETITSKNQTFTLQKMVSEINSSLSGEPQEKPGLKIKDKGTVSSNKTGVIRPKLSSTVNGSKTEREQNHSVSLKEMDYASSEVPLLKTIFKNENAKFPIQDIPDSLSKYSQKENFIKKDKNQTFNHITSTLQIVNRGNSNLPEKQKKTNLISENSNILTNLKTKVTNNTDLLLQDAFTFQSDINPQTNTTTDNQSGNFLTTIRATTPTTSKLNEVEFNNLDMESSSQKITKSLDTVVFTTEPKTNTTKYRLKSQARTLQPWVNGTKNGNITRSRSIGNKERTNINIPFP